MGMTAATVAVRERPILFSAEMVRAILDGKKSQTRRVMKPITGESYGDHSTWLTPLPTCDVVRDSHLKSLLARCPYGVAGERLWVRETCLRMRTEIGVATRDPAFDEFMYADHEDYDICHPSKADAIDLGWRVCPSIHMPRAASRLTLELTDVRVERLQQISCEDVQAEGVTIGDAARWLLSPENVAPWRIAFRELWDSLNAKRGYPWAANPWCWVLSFRRADA